MKSTQKVLARTDCATDIPSRRASRIRIRNRKLAVSLSLRKVPIGPSLLSYRLSLCLTLTTRLLLRDQIALFETCDCEIYVKFRGGNPFHVKFT